MTTTNIPNSQWNSVIINSLTATRELQDEFIEHGQLIRHLTIIDIKFLLQGWRFPNCMQLHTLDLQVESKYHSERCGPGPSTTQFPEILFDLIHRNTHLHTLKITLWPMSISNKDATAYRMCKFQSPTIRELHLMRWTGREVQLTNMIRGCPQLHNLVLDDIELAPDCTSSIFNEADLVHLKKLTLSRVSFRNLDCLVFKGLQLEELSVMSCIDGRVGWICPQLKSLMYNNANLGNWFERSGLLRNLERGGELTKVVIVDCRDDRLKLCLDLLRQNVSHSLEELELGDEELRLLSWYERSQLLAGFPNLKRFNGWRVAAWQCPCNIM